MSDSVITYRYENLHDDQPIDLELTKPGHYRIELAGEGVEVNIKGVFQAKEQETVEVQVQIAHLAQHTTSNTLLRGVASDQAQLKLIGTIKVEPSANQTNAFLTENILLLNEGARAEAIPNLEIQTDEVKCSHAATVSSIPEEQLFYLQSRGIDLKTAQDLIVTGFLQL